MLRILHLVRPCSKNVCKCHNKALKLALYIPIDEMDEIDNENKINDLLTTYKLCSEYNEEFIFDISPKKKD